MSQERPKLTRKQKAVVAVGAAALAASLAGNAVQHRNLQREKRGFTDNLQREVRVLKSLEHSL